jgi:lysophospholipase L1-like esterase
MLHTLTRRWFVAALVLGGLAPLQPASAQNGRSVKTYIALGDSLAFGVTDILPISYGDQGYVKTYADWLATRFDGVRPKVINLGIPGETSSSFFSGQLPPWWDRATLANLNYASDSDVQFSKFLNVVRAEKAARHQVKVVSFALGTNDFVALAFSPAWNAPGADRVDLLEQLFSDVESNYVGFLTALRGELPHSQVLLLNYYNPLEVLGPGDPINQLYAYALLRHDAMVARLAHRFKARRVDVHSAFLGHSLDYTFVLDGNFHPNDLGYDVIAQRMIDATED